MSAGQLFSLPGQFTLDTSSNLQAGAKLYFYVTATSTPKNVYQDRALTTPHANPVLADANGGFAAIWLNNDVLYRAVLKTSADVTLKTWDDIGPNSATDLTSPTLAGNNVFTGTTNKFSSAEPRIILDETDGGTDKRLWDFDIGGGVLKLRTRTDADGVGVDILTVTRGSGTAVTSIALGQTTTIGGNTAATVQTGSFVPAWTGFSAAPGGTVFWRLVGGVAFLQFGSSNTGTSNATTMTFTNLPAEVQPSTAAGPRGACFITDNSAVSIGAFGVTASGVMTFFLGTTPSASGFTNSGTKGFGSFTTLTYAI